MITNYDELSAHVGHSIECVKYGDGVNMALECVTCNEVLLDYDRDEDCQDQLEFDFGTKGGEV